MKDEVTRIRVVASRQRVDAFVAWLRSHDGTALRLLDVSDEPRPRRTGGEFTVYADLVLLEGDDRG